MPNLKASLDFFQPCSVNIMCGVVVQCDRIRPNLGFSCHGSHYTEHQPGNGWSPREYVQFLLSGQVKSRALFVERRLHRPFIQGVETPPAPGCSPPTMISSPSRKTPTPKSHPHRRESGVREAEIRALPLPYVTPAPFFRSS